jgi:hypothetical protein
MLLDDPFGNDPDRFFHNRRSSFADQPGLFAGCGENFPFKVSGLDAGIVENQAALPFRRRSGGNGTAFRFRLGFFNLAARPLLSLSNQGSGLFFPLEDQGQKILFTHSLSPL